VPNSSPIRGVWLQTAAVCFILIGAALRIYIYVAAPSLWEDEVSLAFNIVTRDFASLAGKLDLQQSAPLGFLWLERLSILGFGVSEHSLRIVALLSGVASLPISWIAARKYTTDAAALLVLSLIAFSPGALGYSNEVKPYGTDLLVSCWLLWPASEERKPWIWVLAGSIALTLSTPSLFVMAGIWVHNAFAGWQRRPRKRRFWINWIGVGAFWILVFVLLYRSIYMQQANDDYMQRFWGPTLLSTQSSFGATLALLLKSTLGAGFALGASLPIPLLVFTATLFLLGLAIRPVLIGVPLLAAIAASAFGKWPFSDRLMLFYFLFVVLAIALAAERVSKIFKWKAYVYVAITLLLASFPLKASSWIVRHPAKQTLREAVQFAIHRSEPGQTIYCYAISAPAWLFYTSDWRSPDLDRVQWYKNAFRKLGGNSGNIEARSISVEGEGNELARPWRGGWEVIGVGDGIFRSSSGPATKPPDEGWIENEYERITRKQSGRITLVGLSVGQRGFPDLEQKFLMAGAQPVEQYSGIMSRVDILKIERLK